MESKEYRILALNIAILGIALLILLGKVEHLEKYFKSLDSDLTGKLADIEGKYAEVSDVQKAQQA